MAKQKLNNIRLGLFVVVVAMLFALTVYFIGANQNLFGDNFSISTVLTNAGGLQAGNNVRYSGINVGTVEAIRIISDSTLRVDLKLANRVKPFIRKNAIATVSTDGIVGSALVNIIPGNGNAAQIDEGDFLSAAESPYAADLMTSLGSTNQRLGLFVSDLLEISSKINEGPGTVSLLLRDSLMARNLDQTLINLNHTSALMTQVAAKLERAIDALHDGDGMVHRMLYDTIIMDNVNELVSEISSSIPQQLDTVVADLRSTGKNLAKATKTLNMLTDELKDGKGAIPTLLHDEEMAAKIQGILTNLEQGTAKFDEDMEALRHNFLFRRYFRKLQRQKEKDERSNAP
ncbi:MAG: MCE family protein [Saprospiraceae bacterium]|nr:MCE family protein [Saprospiraceae bacterium]